MQNINNMKKLLNLIYIPALALALGVSGCEDFLTVSAPDQTTSGNYWASQEDALAGLSATYSQMYYGGGWMYHEYKYVFEPFREDVINMGPGAAGYGYMTSIYNFTYTMSSSIPAFIWSNNYWGLSYSNQVIDKVTAMSDDLFTNGMKEQIIGEARFMRGYYHMVLLMNWEKIVLRDKYIVSEGEIEKELSERSDVWDFIFDDFAYAAGVLDKTRDNATKGRATSASANAYLGYAALTRAYEDATRKNEFLETALTALKAENFAGYALEPMNKWLGMFNGTNENCNESIFELQFSPVTSGNAYYKHLTHYWIASEELGGWEGILPSDMLYQEFKKEGRIALNGTPDAPLYDNRLYSTLWFKDDYFNGAPEQVWGYNYDEWFTEGDKPVFRKFIPADETGMESDETAMNMMLMRYANVLLMRAEVYNEQNHPELAIPLINEVRSRANMPAMRGSSQAEVRAQIEHERIVEFALENFRFYDLRRWGKTKQALDAANRPGFNPAIHNYYYLPESEMNTNGGVK